ncbi:MAG: selenocysteine-specific translation elongation factor [Thermomicrobiales bacterium]|nr:selenocysteine-specific translation elongation factor [Thermomicrobiales bacterium]
MSQQPPPRPYVVGTAGHVDHGKSTLVHALTGIDPDRLAEEKARAMTIDLGFAWLTLPGGHAVSLVDVPGHERFIKNMLAGVGGIDTALLVIAADEGPMPQTTEHLAILDLLGISAGVIALSKADTVDTDWLEYVAEDVRERVRGTTFHEAPVVPVSALTGEGLPELVLALERSLEGTTGRTAQTGARLPIDRVFTVAGFGAVVTGTLSGSPLRVGDEVRLYPESRLLRIRGLQSHQQPVTHAQPGSRVAVNLSGVSAQELRRGQVLAQPGLMTPTQRVDVRLDLLPSSPIALKQNAELDFFTGATEVAARVTLLDREVLEPGESALVQLRLGAPVAVLKRDRFIVRRASPSETIGGGGVIDANPARHRRFRPETIRLLETLASGAPEEVLLQALALAPLPTHALAAGVAGLDSGQAAAAAATLQTQGQAVVLPGARARDSLLVGHSFWEHWLARLESAVAAFHREQPFRPGMPREVARRQLAVAQAREFDTLVAAADGQGLVTDDGATLRLPDFHPTLDPARRQRADHWLTSMKATPHTPPSPAEFDVDAETLAVLAHNGEVVRAGEAVVFRADTWDVLVAETLAFIDEHGTITMAQFRDHFGASRKYAQAALDHMDRLKITRRSGDDRVRATPRTPT